MQKIKTLFIFTFMVVILFGAYHVIYQRPDTPPPEVAKELDNLPDALELDLGTEVSAQDLLDELNEDSGLAEEKSVVTAADNGQFGESRQLMQAIVARMQGAQAMRHFIQRSETHTDIPKSGQTCATANRQS